MLRYYPQNLKQTNLNEIEIKSANLSICHKGWWLIWGDLKVVTNKDRHYEPHSWETAGIYQRRRTFNVKYSVSLYLSLWFCYHKSTHWWVKGVKGVVERRDKTTLCELIFSLSLTLPFSPNRLQGTARILRAGKLSENTQYNYNCSSCSPLSSRLASGAG